MNTLSEKINKVCFRAPSPHLDYYQDDEARIEFHKTFPLINGTEGHVLTGYYDTEDLAVGVMLGVWKPLNPTQVNLYMIILAPTGALEEGSLSVCVCMRATGILCSKRVAAAF